MGYIITNISLPILIQDTAALVVSVSIGFFIWIIKQSYDKHEQELKSLKKLEICLSGDLATNKHNEEYLNDWMDNLKKNKLFSCAFRTYELDNSELVYITNLELINKINTLSYGLNILFNDLKNNYDVYTSNSLRFLDKDLVNNWKEMNINTLVQLNIPKNNFYDFKRQKYLRN